MVRITNRQAALLANLLIDLTYRGWSLPATMDTNADTAARGPHRFPGGQNVPNEAQRELLEFLVASREIAIDELARGANLPGMVQDLVRQLATAVQEPGEERIAPPQIVVNQANLPRLIDELITLFQKPLTARSALGPDRFNRLRDALMLPEEIQELPDKLRRQLLCTACGLEMEEGEVMSHHNVGPDDHALYCHKCISASTLPCVTRTCTNKVHRVALPQVTCAECGRKEKKAKKGGEPAAADPLPLEPGTLPGANPGGGVALGDAMRQAQTFTEVLRGMGVAVPPPLRRRDR